MANVDAIRGYYDGRVDEELSRLDAAWLERAVTRSFLSHFLTAPAKILDIGGGPGRLALELAAAGHVVTLADLSPGNVAHAAKACRLADGHR